MKDMILSLSGGLDSSSLLFEYKDRISLAVFFKYGENHEKMELAAAKKVAKKAGVELRIIDLTKVFSGFNSALLSGADNIPTGDYTEESMKKIVVPFRNGIFLSILAGIADGLGCKYIALANHSGDHAVFKDCRKEFCDTIGVAIKLGTDNEIEFFAPYVNSTKGELALRGMKAGLKPEWTYSCYKGVKGGCGECPTCVERIEAIKYAKNQLKGELN